MISTTSQPITRKLLTCFFSVLAELVFFGAAALVVAAFFLVAVLAAGLDAFSTTAFLVAGAFDVVALGAVGFAFYPVARQIS